MGFANSRLESLRKKARGLILPTQEILSILESRLDFSSLRRVADFGAGTLYFSEFFAKKLGNTPSEKYSNRGGAAHK